MRNIGSVSRWGSVDRQLVVWVLFFCSGMPALVYQLTWQRALFRIFGINIESETIIVTAFMVGLGLGSLAGGWLSTCRKLNLLLILSAIESLIGIFGIVSLDLFDKVGALTIQLPLSGTAFVVFAIVVVPTVLMGATLPVLVGHLAKRNGNVGDTVGQLYFANTLGAGAACLLAVVTIFPFLGMQKAVYSAAATNLCVALGALIAWLVMPAHDVSERARGIENPLETEPWSKQAGNLPIIAPVLGLALSFLSGMIGLSFEIMFLHTASFASGTGAATFAETLGAFLIGLAGGAKRAADLCRSDAEASTIHRYVLRSLLSATLVSVIFLPTLLLPALLPAAMTSRFVQVCVILLVYIFARYWGCFFPLLIHRAVRPDERAGARLSYLYLANLLGAAIGGIVTGFFLMDVFTLRNLAAVLALSCFAFAVIAAKVMGGGNQIRQPRLILGGALLLYGLVFATPLLRPLIGILQPTPSAPLVTVVENRNGIITVDRDRRVYGNGAYDGQFNIDLVHDTNDVKRAYALELYHPAPRHVLMIGMSSGSWAQVIANAPDVETLTIIEINPGYIQLVAADTDNASLLSNPKVKLIIDDGRRWLRRHPEQLFDAIISNTSIHYRANATNVLSVEFMHLIQQHLAPGGTLFYNTTGSERVMRTGCTSFAYGTRLDNFLIASDRPLAIDAERWRLALLAWRIDGKPVIDQSQPDDYAVLMRDLALPADITDARLAGPAKQMEDCSSILARTAGLDVITDDNMGTEWRVIFAWISS